MLNTDITNFRENIFELLEQTIRYNEPVNISARTGNTALTSGEDYSNLVETLYLSFPPKERAKIIGGLYVFLEDCLSEDEITW